MVYLWGIIIGALIDVSGALVITQLLDANDKVFFFLAILAVVWVGPLVLGVWFWFKFWLLYHLSIKNKMVNAILAEFYRLGFPSAREYIDADHYLSTLASSEDIDINVRTKAAYYMGEIEGYRVSKPLTMLFAVRFSLDSAMKEYGSGK